VNAAGIAAKTCRSSGIVVPVRVCSLTQNSGLVLGGKLLKEDAVKKKYGGRLPKKPPLISKVFVFFLICCFFNDPFADHERAYFDSADWALGKQGAQKPKGPLEALRPKLQPTHQQTRSRRSSYAPADGSEGVPGDKSDAAQD
ncbi:putative CAMP-regulated phosphoprotein 19-related protein, partial [Trifolium medium]|nr:putative CAMP-regulated phosphoprotein 19-related protein [Trifolium medium]